MVTSNGDRFVRRQSSTRTNVAFTSTADLGYDTSVLSEGGYGTWTSDEVSVDTTGKYLIIHGLGRPDSSGTARSSGFSGVVVNGTAQNIRGLSGSYYQRNTGTATDGGGIGVGILDLSASDTVGSHINADISGEINGDFDYEADSGSGIQLIKLSDSEDFLELEHLSTDTAQVVANSDIDSTRPWIDSSGSWTKLTWGNENSDTGSWHSGTSGDVTLPANKKFLIVYTILASTAENTRAAIISRLSIGGTNRQYASNYFRSPANQAAVVNGMYLHETGGSSETLFIEATQECNDSTISDCQMDRGLLQIIELPSGAEWIHVDNGTTDSHTSDFANTSTWYKTPLSSTFRSHGSSDLSLDGTNDAVQNDSGSTMSVLAIAWLNFDRDANTSGNRKIINTKFVNGGTSVNYGWGGGYSRGNATDNVWHAAFLSAATLDLANSADLHIESQCRSTSSNSDIGVYASGNRHFLGVQVLDLSTLAVATITGAAALSGSATQTSIGDSFSIITGAAGLDSVLSTPYANKIVSHFDSNTGFLWRLNDASGNPQDYSSNAIHADGSVGTFNYSEADVFADGASIDFNQFFDDRFVKWDANYSPNIGASWSTGAFIKINSFTGDSTDNTGEINIINKESWGTNGFRLGLSANSTGTIRYVFLYDSNAQAGIFYDTGRDLLGEWLHIVGTYNATDLELFINGVSVGTSTRTLTDSTTDMGIGEGWAGTASDATLDANMSNVFFVEHVFADAEIKDLSEFAFSSKINIIGAREVPGDAILSGSGTLNITSIKEASSSITVSGIATLTAAAIIDITGATSLSVVGSLTAQGFKEVSGLSVISSAATLTATSIKESIGQGAYSGNATLVISSLKESYSTVGINSGDNTSFKTRLLSYIDTTTGLYYSMDEASAPLIDNTTSGFDTTNTGGTIVYQKDGFNGGNSVEHKNTAFHQLWHTSYDPDESAAFTAGGWIKINYYQGDTINNNGDIFLIRNEVWNVSGWRIWVDDAGAAGTVGEFVFRDSTNTRTDAAYQPNGSGNSVNFGEWYHVIGVYDGVNTRKLYVNGILRDTISEGPIIDNTSAGGFLVGGGWRGTAADASYSADLDEAFFVEKVLTDEQIFDLSQFTPSSQLGVNAFADLYSTISISGSGSLTTTGQREVYGSISLNGDGTLAASGLIEVSGLSSLSSNATVTAIGLQEIASSASLSASGTLAVAAFKETAGATLTLSSGSLTVAASKEAYSTLSISGSGAVVSVALKEAIATVSLSGSATLSATSVITQFGVVSLSGSGSAISSGVIERLATSSVSGSSSLTISSLKEAFTSVSLSSDGVISVIGQKESFATISLSGDASFAISGSRDAIAISALTGVSSLNVSGFRETIATSALTGSGSVAISGFMEAVAASVLSAQATIIATASELTVITGAISLTGTGSLNISSIKESFASIAISGSGTLSATAFKETAGITLTLSSGSLVIAASKETTSSALLNASGTLSLVGLSELYSTVSLSASGNLSSTSLIEVLGLASLSASGSLVSLGLRDALAVSSMTGQATLTITATESDIITGAALLTSSGSLNVSSIKEGFTTATLSGFGSLVATGLSELYSTLSISGISSFVSVGIEEALGLATLNGVGSLASSSLAEYYSTINVSGQGSLISTGLTEEYGSIVLDGSATLAAISEGTASGTIVLSSSGSLSSIATKETFGDIVLTSSATLATAGVSEVFANTSLSSVGSILTSAIKEGFAIGSIVGQGSLAATGVIEISGAVSLISTGTLSAVAEASSSASVTLSAQASVSAQALIDGFGATSLAGNAAVLSSGFLETSGAILATGSATISVASVGETSGTVALTGTAEKDSIGTIEKLSSSSLSGIGSLASIGSKDSYGGAVIVTTSTLSIASIFETFGSVPLSGTGTTTATGVKLTSSFPIDTPTSEDIVVTVSVSSIGLTLTVESIGSAVSSEDIQSANSVEDIGITTSSEDYSESMLVT